ncbi:hypothetical protein [Krasilnikovia sp. MM14-A1004]|uniref:hypothetical protein n=1 Tax=Krasilnikovia sp. MM14-A1004 TaxID=3373541 RepID=UPI00399D2FEE
MKVKPFFRRPLSKAVSPAPVIRRMLAAKADAGLSATTVRHIHRMIRNVLGDAVREELIHRNRPRRSGRPRSGRSSGER